MIIQPEQDLPTSMTRRGLLLLILLLSLPVHADELLVFAAASLKPALDELVATPAAKSIATIRVSYAASSQLARQIDQGAPAALFVSADGDWMDFLDQRMRLAVDSRSDLLGNALVLVAGPKSTATPKIAEGFALADALGANGRLAIGEPGSVPAGKYAKAALTKLGVWSGIDKRIIAADNVRSALRFVASGEAPLGIVYRSDAVSEPSVRLVDTFPPDSHAPIRYPVAIIAGHDDDAARALLALLHGADSAALFRRHGFDAPPR